VPIVSAHFRSLWGIYRAAFATRIKMFKYQQRYTRTKSPVHGLYNFVHTRWHRALRRPSRQPDRFQRSLSCAIYAHRKLTRPAAVHACVPGTAITPRTCIYKQQRSTQHATSAKIHENCLCTVTRVITTNYQDAWLGSRVVSCWTRVQKGPASNRSRDAVG